MTFYLFDALKDIEKDKRSFQIKKKEYKYEKRRHKVNSIKAIGRNQKTSKRNRQQKKEEKIEYLGTIRKKDKRSFQVNWALYEKDIKGHFKKRI